MSQIKCDENTLFMSQKMGAVKMSKTTPGNMDGWFNHPLLVK